MDAGPVSGRIGRQDGTAAYLTDAQWLAIIRRHSEGEVGSSDTIWFPRKRGESVIVRRADGTGYLVHADGAVLEVDDQGKPIEEA